MGTEIRYGQEVVRIAGRQFFVEKCKVTEKHDSEDLVASQQKEPYAKVVGKVTYEVQLTGVDPYEKPFFNRLLVNQDSQSLKNMQGLPNFQNYYFDSNHKMKLDYNLQGFFIEEVSKENADPFDVKASCVKRKMEEVLQTSGVNTGTAKK